MGEVINLFKKDGCDLCMNIFEIAKAFLSMESMSNKKIQKLCYYAQAWHLALNGEPLIDCEFEAWIHGPVCPQLYRKYKSNGYQNICKEARLPESIATDSYVKEFLESIYNIYGNKSGDDLELLTHNESPWKNARIGYEEWEPAYTNISQMDMKNYYSKIKNIH